MLVLSRRRGDVMLVDLSRLIPLNTSDPQALAEVLSKPIAMTVTETHIGSCKLGYDADKLVRIHRIERLKRRATNGSDTNELPIAS